MNSPAPFIVTAELPTDLFAWADRLRRALAAGIPHVIMPMAHDQPDNAARIERLGVGATLWPRQFRGPALSKALDRLLNSPPVRERCQQIAARFDSDGLNLTCDAIEQLTQLPDRSLAGDSVPCESKIQLF